MLRRAVTRAARHRARCRAAGSNATPLPSRRFIPMHPKQLARKLQAMESLTLDEKTTLIDVFRLFRVCLRVRWMRHTDVLRVLAHDLVGNHHYDIAASHDVAKFRWGWRKFRHKTKRGQFGREPSAVDASRDSNDNGTSADRDQLLKDFVDSLHDLADKANFDSVDNEWVARSLFAPTPTHGGITVVPGNKDDYGTVRLWVRGRNRGPSISTGKSKGYLDKIHARLQSKLAPRGDQNPDNVERFSTVFAAVGVLKPHEPTTTASDTREEVMHLIMVNDVPTSQLHLLLPTVSVKMGAFDRAKILFMGGVGGLTVAAKTAAVAYCAAESAIQSHVAAKGSAAAAEVLDKFSGVLANDSVHSGLMMALMVVGGVAFQTYAHFHSTKSEFASALRHQLDEKTVARNEVVVSTLVEETELQELKEVMVGYGALLGDPDVRDRMETTGVTASEIKRAAEQWLTDQFGTKSADNIEFDAQDAVAKMVRSGILDTSVVNRQDGVEEDAYRSVGLDVAFDRLRQSAHREVDRGGQLLPRDFKTN